MAYNGPDRREFARLEKNFVVSYRIYGDSDAIDTSQTRNIGEGGMLLTTNRSLEKGTVLAIEIKLPFFPMPIRLLGNTLESKEIAKNLIYETRLSFTYMDDQSKEFVKGAVQHFLKEGAQ